jgi:hypothetical protein
MAMSALEELIERHGIGAKFPKMLSSCSLSKLALASLLVVTGDAQPLQLAHDEWVYICKDFWIDAQRD